MSHVIRKLREGGIQTFLLACALVSVATTIGILLVLISEAAPFFREVSLRAFLTGTVWAPLIEPRQYGVLPLICGTAWVAGGGLIVGGPLGLASAIYLSEYAPRWARELAKPILEILAGIPSVVYGYFALNFITPYLLRPLFPQTSIFNAAAGALVVGIMILPMVCSLCDDSLRAVPRSLREAGYALSATKFEVSTRIVLPGALSGVVAACLLALSRAIGETMAVTLASGMTPNLSWNPLESMQTLTSYIVQVSKGESARGSIEYQSIFAVGLALFAITLATNLVARRILRRFREIYE